jgi:hypothetical protein
MNAAPPAGQAFEGSFAVHFPLMQSLSSGAGLADNVRRRLVSIAVRLFLAEPRRQLPCGLLGEPDSLFVREHQE